MTLQYIYLGPCHSFSTDMGLVSYPDPLNRSCGWITLPLRAERGSGDIAIKFVASGCARRWNFSGTIKLQPRTVALEVALWCTMETAEMLVYVEIPPTKCIICM